MICTRSLMTPRRILSSNLILLFKYYLFCFVNLSRTIDTLNVDKIKVKKQNKAKKCLETLYVKQDELHKLMKMNELNKEELVHVIFNLPNETILR